MKYKKYKPDTYNLQRMRKIGCLLKEYRIENLLSREELSKTNMISRSLIERAETGQNITLQSYFRLCDILMADPIEIMNIIDD
ncbi:MAG: helix-turn-helix domain-containing protein [bacterium]